MKLKAIVAAIAFVALPVSLHSEESNKAAWTDIRAATFQTRTIVEQAEGFITLDVPYRAEDDRRVPVSAKASFGDGRTVKSLTLIVDENPMPVSAVFRMDRPQERFGVTVDMRLNGPSVVRAVVEASDGQLYMAAVPVKTSGLGACAAPPVTGTQEALATLGEMEMHGAAAHGQSQILSRTAGAQVRLDMRHPQHSGMQMDQITLLYIPARYVERVEVWGGGEKYFTMEGSITLSENPGIAFDLPDGDKGAIRVRLTDTEEAIFERTFPLGGA